MLQRFLLTHFVATILSGCSASADAPIPGAEPPVVPACGADSVLVSHLLAGPTFTCVSLLDDAVRCSGFAMSVGDCDFELQGIVHMAAGPFHPCAVVDDGSVYCWTSISATRLERVEGLAPAMRVATGLELDGCAVLTDGGVQCWRLTKAGLVADPALPLEGIVEIASGWNHTCAMVDDGTVACWGSNTHGQIGGDFAKSDTPAIVPGVSGAVRIAVGGETSCIIRADGTVACWGSNAYGQLGSPADGDKHPVPVVVDGIGDPVGLSVGAVHTCALLSGGEVRCWGDNAVGALGNGTTADSTSPVVVTGLSGVIEISVGGSYSSGVAGGHSCARLADRSVLCWGANDRHQLGVGPDDNRLVPMLSKW